MKEVKISVKLIDVTHSEWLQYKEKIEQYRKVTFSVNKDTYTCIGDDKVVNDVIQIKNMFEGIGKTIIVNTGGL